MKRLETETFEEYKVRRAEANFETKQKLGRWLVWDSSTLGTKKGKFKKYTVEEIQAYLDRPPVVIEEEPTVAEVEDVINDVEQEDEQKLVLEALLSKETL